MLFVNAVENCPGSQISPQPEPGAGKRNSGDGGPKIHSRVPVPRRLSAWIAGQARQRRRKRRLLRSLVIITNTRCSGWLTSSFGPPDQRAKRLILAPCLASAPSRPRVSLLL